MNSISKLLAVTLFATLWSFSVNAAETFICSPYGDINLEAETKKHKRGIFRIVDTVVLNLNENQLTSVAWSGVSIQFGRQKAYKDSIECDTKHGPDQSNLECWNGERFLSDRPNTPTDMDYSIFTVRPLTDKNKTALDIIRNGQELTKKGEVAALYFNYEHFSFLQDDVGKEFSHGGFKFEFQSNSPLGDNYLCK